KLTPHGVVLMHISNRHLELRSVVEGIAAANGLKTWIWRRDKDEADDIRRRNFRGKRRGHRHARA
ncbi:MAG: hypothetical protein WCD83_10935, partial [Pseudolabrys sp.]